MTYRVKEVFYTLQGEGYWTGRAAVFCRFSLCNLWTGREEDRAKAVCQFCDTDFIGGDKYELDDLVDKIEYAFRGDECDRMVVFTGGEPLIQLSVELIAALKDRGFYIAVETNGTLAIPAGIDWVCVSPKANAKLFDPDIIRANEIKLVFPQPDLMPDAIADMYTITEPNCRWLSPMDGPDIAKNTAAAIEYVLDDPYWRLNIQTHKYIGVP